MPELPHERHNRLGVEMATEIAKLPAADRLILVESIATAIIGTLPYNQGKAAGIEWAISTLADAIRDRLKEKSDG
jgi:hypothetical protein